MILDGKLQEKKTFTPQMKLWQERWEQMRKEMLSQSHISETKDSNSPQNRSKQLSLV